MFHLGFKSALQLTPKKIKLSLSLSHFLSLKQLKMLKFTAALLFAQVLLAAPLPQELTSEQYFNDRRKHVIFCYRFRKFNCLLKLRILFL